MKFLKAVGTLQNSSKLLKGFAKHPHLCRKKTEMNVCMKPLGALHSTPYIHRKETKMCVCVYVCGYKTSRGFTNPPLYIGFGMSLGASQNPFFIGASQNPFFIGILKNIPSICRKRTEVCMYVKAIGSLQSLLFIGAS